MKANQLKSLTVVAITATGFMACNPLNKMAKNAENLQYTTTPNPLEMHGDSVAITVDGTVPPKFFNKKVTATLKPYFKVDGKKVAEFDSLNLVGESADANGKKIDFENGGNYKLTSTVAYSDELERGELWVTAVGKYKGKVKDIQDFKLADGTKITPRLVKADDKPIIGKDNFQRITTDVHKAEINFLINSANVRGSELRADDIKTLFADIKAKSNDSTFQFKSLAVEAYASPDGEETKNNDLSNNRAEKAADAVNRQLKKNKVEGAKAEGFTATTGKGEDWSGFKSAMEASEIKDKELIIRVLQMYTDNEKRETEIKNLAETYVEVKDQILPQLRRSQIALSIDKVGKSDEEIAQLATENPTALNVEELLYAATLTNDLTKQEDIYSKAVSQFGDDWRAHNNLGYVKLMNNDLAAAETNFNNAMSKNNNPIINNNLGVVARLNGDRAKAMEYYNKANGAGSEVNYNKGIVYILDGDYSSAVSNLKGAGDFNTALAQLLNGNNDGALQTLNNSEDGKTAEGYYLKAVIAARMDKGEMVSSNLKIAIEKDPSLEAKAKKDAEFIKYSF